MESAQLRSQRGLARTTDQCEIRCERQGRYTGASAEAYGLSERIPTGIEPGSPPFMR
jgi:hypothetical protein